MAGLRLEVRLDEERRRRLDAIAEARDETASDVVRALIDDAYWEVDQERRLAAVRRIAETKLEEMPDPEELSRQLDEKYDFRDLP